MPRGRKKAEAPSSSPKSTRSSRARKKVEIPVSEEVPAPSNDRPEKMSSKRQTTTTGRKKISVEIEKNEVGTKTKTSVVAGRKSKSAKVETSHPEPDQSLVRKSSRSKKETEKFSQYKVQGNKSREKEVGNDENSNQSKVKKKANQSKVDTVEMPDDKGTTKDSNQGKPTKPRKATKSNQSSKDDDEAKDEKEEESNQIKNVKKTRKAGGKVVQIEETVPDKTSGKGRKISDTQVSPIKKNQKKRKLSAEVIEAELTDSSKKAKVSSVKKKNSPKKRLRTIASGLSKDGKVLQKNPPRKTLGNKDILGLLDEDPGEVNEDEPELEPEPEKAPGSVEISPSVSLNKAKVPVWRQERQEAAQSVQTAGNDVFDPMNYLEEFGPEDVSVCPPKKKPRKRKKDTKAILVFGKNHQSNGVKKVVKEAHNLKTPGAARKTKKVANLKPLPPLGMFTSDVQKSPIPQVTLSTFTSDVSTGAQNYFHSDIQFDNDDPNPPLPQPEVSEHLQVSGKNFTPKVPKNISRLKSGSCSTPNVSASNKKPAPTTVKEQMKNAFGFDDTEDESEPENTSLVISPVKKVKNPVLEMFEGDSILEGRGAPRLSTIPTVRVGGAGGVKVPRAPVEIVSTGEEGPFRISHLSKAKQIERDLLTQVKLMRLKEEMGRKNKEKSKTGRSSRTSPRKKFSKKDPIACSTLLEDPSAAPKQKNIKEMFEAAKNKRVVEDSVSEASSLYEDPPEDENNCENSQENVDTNSPSPLKNVKKLAVSKVYKRKTENTNNTFALDQSSKLDSPKKATKKDKAFNNWAKHQTSHFSEVEDFDLSFT